MPGWEVRDYAQRDERALPSGEDLKRILLIGGCGSIGRRYHAILKKMNCEIDVYDLAQEKEDPERILRTNCDRAVIASPTETHMDYAYALASRGVPFLCEKPLSKSVDECRRLARKVRGNGVQSYVVNNYAYVVQMMNIRSVKRITYDYYHTGRDGIYWDACQLIYLDKDVRLKSESPLWQVTINDVPVKYRWLEMSYIEMLQDFVSGETADLWTVSQGLGMSEAVVRRIKHEAVVSHSSALELDAVSGKDLRDDRGDVDLREDLSHGLDRV